MNKIIDLCKKHQEIINYLFFGFLTTVICLVVYYSLVLTVLNPNNPILLQIANVVSWCSGVVFAFFTNRKFVFKSKNKNSKKEFVSFIVARLITLFMDMGIMFIGVTLLKGNDKIIKIISQIAVVVGNYLFSKLFVFKKK